MEIQHEAIFIKASLDLVRYKDIYGRKQYLNVENYLSVSLFCYSKQSTLDELLLWNI